MRVKQPTPEEEQGWKDWLAEPEREPIREVASRFDPWSLYKLKTTGQRVFIMSFNEPSPMKCNWCGGSGGPVPPGDDPCSRCGGSGKILKVTCRVGVSGEFNLVTFERAVFGIDCDDLEPCDPPGPEELVGTLDLPIEVVKDLRDKYPSGPPPSVYAVLMLKYPLKKGGDDNE